MVIQYTQPYKILFDPYQIKDQCLIKEHIFNDDFKTDIIAGKLKPDVDLTSLTNYIHFIWVGQKPFSQTQFTKNLMGINTFFEDKQLILWGEIFDEETKRFCEDNNILLLNHEDLLKNANPNIVKLHNIHKKLLPSNEGTRSDILRLLIMQKCGGIYCDVDNEALEDKRELTSLEDLNDFTLRRGVNDVIIAKKANLEIIEEIFEMMLNRETGDNKAIELGMNFYYGQFPIRSSSVCRTLVITGPCLYDSFPKIIKFFNLFKTNSAQSWINGIEKYISQNKNLNEKEEKDLNELENKIVYSVLYEMHYRGRLNIARFQPIFDRCIKYPKMRENIILKLLIDIKKEHYHEDFIGKKKEFKEVITNTIKEFEKFNLLSKKVDQKEERLINFIALKKAIKTNNAEMINFYLDKEIKIDEYGLAQLLLHAFKNDNFPLLEKLIEKYKKVLDLSDALGVLSDLYNKKLLNFNIEKWERFLKHLKIHFNDEQWKIILFYFKKNINNDEDWEKIFRPFTPLFISNIEEILAKYGY